MAVRHREGDEGGRLTGAVADRRTDGWTDMYLPLPLCYSNLRIFFPSNFVFHPFFFFLKSEDDSGFVDLKVGRKERKS